MQTPGRKNRKIGGETVVTEMIKKDFQNEKIEVSRIQKGTECLGKPIVTELSQDTYHKVSNAGVIRNSCKASGEEGKKTTNKRVSDFSTATLETRRQWDNTIKRLREGDLPP